MRTMVLRLTAWTAMACLALAARTETAAPRAGDALARSVEAAVTPVMKRLGVPGVSVAVTQAGRTRVFCFGVASRETGVPVDERTRFEVGSVTKTFTATLASWAQERGALALSDPVSAHLPALKGTAFGDVQLLHLGTHTPGGLPLQVPDSVRDEAELMRWLAAWKPAYPAGTMRTYANPGIGMLGVVAAKSLGENYATLIERQLLPALGLSHTQLAGPEGPGAADARGYTADDEPARLTRGVLSAEAYGLRSTAADLARWLEANMDEVALEAPLRRAIAGTHTGWFAAGPMTQDLVWEQYAYPVALPTLLAGNGRVMILEPNAVTELRPPQAPRADVWINKTGSTRGFSAYVAFVPQRRIGVVVLANKAIPTEERVGIAYRIVSAIDAPTRRAGSRAR